jgi:hypothetical protein
MGLQRRKQEEEKRQTPSNPSPPNPPQGQSGILDRSALHVTLQNRYDIFQRA